MTAVHQRHAAWPLWSATSTAPPRTPASPTRSRLLIGDGRIPLEHPAAQRAGADRRARRLPDHGDPRVRRAARRRVRRGAAGRRHVHPGARRPAPRPRPGAAARAPATRTRSTSTARPPPRRPGLAAAYADGGRPSCRRTSAATATSRPGCRCCRPRSPRRTTRAACPTDPEQIMVTPGALTRGRRSSPRRSPVPATGCWWSRRSTPTPPRRSGTAAPGSPARPVDPDGWDLDAVGGRAAADRAAAGLPDPRLPEPDRAPDDRRAARGVRRPPAARAHGRGRRRGAPGARPRGPGDAAAVRGVRPGHDHHRQRQQDVLGRPAARLDPRAARRDGPADPRPGRPRPRRAGARAAGAGPAAGRPRRRSSTPHRARLREQRDAARRVAARAPARVAVPPARRRAGAVVRAARPRSAPPSPPRPSAAA